MGRRLKMSDKIKCSIDFDDEWIQEDCHWKFDRIFTLTYEILDDTISEPTFYCTLNGRANDTQEIQRTDNKTVYTLRWSEYKGAIDPASEYLSVTAVATWKEGEELKSAEDTLEYFFKGAPPAMVDTDDVKDINIEYVAASPGKIKCSWKNYYDCNKESNSLRGYSIELYHRSAGKTLDADFEKVGFLKWDEAALQNGNFEITTDESLLNSYAPVTGEVVEVVYININPSTELYITNPEKTEFFFTPKYFKIRKFNEEDTQIKPGDEYEFRIYPYNVYGSHFTYDEDGNICGTDISALITNEGTLSTIRKVSKGIVRVKVGNNWEEGQVWVMKDGQWKEAEAVYVMNESTWKEAK